jgi:hypothetical protein
VSDRGPGPHVSDRGLRESVNGMPFCVYVRLYELSRTYQGDPVAFIGKYLVTSHGGVGGGGNMLTKDGSHKV